jgi:hypothetical protein
MPAPEAKAIASADDRWHLAVGTGGDDDRGTPAASIKISAAAPSVVAHDSGDIDAFQRHRPRHEVVSAHPPRETHRGTKPHRGNGLIGFRRQEPRELGVADGLFGSRQPLAATNEIRRSQIRRRDARSREHSRAFRDACTADDGR